MLTSYLFFFFKEPDCSFAIRAYSAQNLKIDYAFPPPRNQIRANFFIQIYTVDSLWDKTISSEVLQDIIHPVLKDPSYSNHRVSAAKMCPDKRGKLYMLRFIFLSDTNLYFVPCKWPGGTILRYFFFSSGQEG